MIPLLLVSLSTFNLRGLGDEIKQHQLDCDCTRYNMDIICLQETKVAQFFEHIFPKTGNKLIVLDQFSGWHRGIGFLITKCMLPCITEIKQISTNVAYVDFVVQSRNGQPVKCRVVNAYDPTSPAAEKSPKLRDEFYEELTCAIDAPKNYELFVCGDFNSRIGKLTLDDIDNGISRHVGKYGIGKRNVNGEHLLSFVIDHDLFICNTAFKHSSRHLTTRTGYIKDYNNSDPNVHKTVPFYSMIDYVICRSRFKGTLVDSRAFGGTTTNSDHKLVAAKFRFQDRHLTFIKRSKTEPVYEVSSLSSREEIQRAFSQQVSRNISNDSTTLCDPQTDCNTKVDMLVSSLKSAADKVMGLKRRQKPRDYSNDIEIAEMSQQR